MEFQNIPNLNKNITGYKTGLQLFNSMCYVASIFHMINVSGYENQ